MSHLSTMRADQDCIQWLQDALNARHVRAGERIQRLWGGYGELRRYHVEGGIAGDVVVKRVAAPERPIDAAGRRSHDRKIRSYEVEAAFYRAYAHRCSANCRVPVHYENPSTETGSVLILEDLTASGYAPAAQQLAPRQVASCTTWLAHFHANFMGQTCPELWPTGTYWHLATRPDELGVLGIRHPHLQAAARRIDEVLHNARFRSIVHGDAKSDNFCFDGSDRVAAVDFQYVGGGVGVQDLVYFMSSCLSDSELRRNGASIIDHYFSQLDRALERSERGAEERQQILGEWRRLIPWAWADLYRFLLGWAPADRPSGHGWQLTTELLDSWGIDLQTAGP